MVGEAEGSGVVKQAAALAPPTSMAAIEGELGVLSDFLPGELVRAILLHLPAKAVLRFRAVSRTWSRLLRDPVFLAEHHFQQPSAPVVDFSYQSNIPGNQVRNHLTVQALQLRTGEIREVIKIAWNSPAYDDNEASRVHGSCDGLLLLKFLDTFLICNPATRQRALLPRLQSNEIAALYATDGPLRGRDYRLLFHRGPANQKVYFIMNLKALDDPRTRTRCIGRFASSAALDEVLARGTPPSLTKPPFSLDDSLYWRPQRYAGDPNPRVLVFNTATDTFFLMGAPVVREDAVLLAVEGKLALSASERGSDVIELWLLENGKCPEDKWLLYYRINLPFHEITDLDGDQDSSAWMKTEEGEVLMINEASVLQYDSKGRFVRNWEEVWSHDLSPHMYKECVLRVNICWNMGSDWF